MLFGREWAHTYVQERERELYVIKFRKLHWEDMKSAHEFKISSYVFCFIKVVVLGEERQFLNNFSSTFKRALFWFLFVQLSLLLSSKNFLLENIHIRFFFLSGGRVIVTKYCFATWSKFENEPNLFDSYKNAELTINWPFQYVGCSWNWNNTLKSIHTLYRRK